MKRSDLLEKLKSNTQKLTKEESDALGPVTSRELAPITGDSFVDSFFTRNRWEVAVTFKDGTKKLISVSAQTEAEAIEQAVSTVKERSNIKHLCIAYV